MLTDKGNPGDVSDGSLIQSLSFHKMAMPLVVKNASMLNDETATERNGEKYLSLSNRVKKRGLGLRWSWHRESPVSRQQKKSRVQACYGKQPSRPHEKPWPQRGAFDGGRTAYPAFSKVFRDTVDPWG